MRRDDRSSGEISKKAHIGTTVPRQASRTTVLACIGCKSVLQHTDMHTIGFNHMDRESVRDGCREQHCLRNRCVRHYSLLKAWSRVEPAVQMGAAFLCLRIRQTT